MLRVAITGNFGVGKSIVLNQFMKLGFQVLSADRIISKLYSNKKILKKIKKEFKTTNKKKLSKIVFSSRLKRKKLERILHPPAIKIMKAQFKSLKKSKNKIVFAEVPLLFESKLEGIFDKIILVKTSRKKCLERLAKKGIKKIEAYARINAQIPDSKKSKLSDFIIENSGTKTSLKRKVKSISSELLNRC